MTARNELSRSAAISRFLSVRAITRALTEDLTPEDMQAQSMPDVSPTKWHLAHTTWFFETFVLETFARDFSPFDQTYGFLFNSYYESVGARHPRAQRGVVSRPRLSEILDYRSRTEEAIIRCTEEVSSEHWPELWRRIELGLHHEMQHQELLLMDIKHVFSSNPLYPALQAPTPEQRSARNEALTFSRHAGGLLQFGHDGDGFAFDNEGPQHPQWLEAFELADRLITNREYLEFVEDGGYTRHDLWLSDGWSWCQAERIEAPLYWVHGDDGWLEFGFYGLEPLDPDAPVMHVSAYEADAFARWNGARLPTEFEWEAAAGSPSTRGRFLEDHVRAPGVAGAGPSQLLGDLWEITASAYQPYPRYRVPSGALGEYNGKFMANQVVTRGGSFATPGVHIRPSYRNFFYPHQRWPFQGFRLARDI